VKATKGMRAEAYGREMVGRWEHMDAEERRANKPPHESWWKLALAWRMGYEAGVRDQRKRDREKRASVGKVEEGAK